jgi:hypothetical protein
MATENKGVMVYLPKEVEEYITEFCTEYSITRKDKEGNILPSLGTGIVTYLKSQMSGESPGEYIAKPSKLPSNGLSKEEVLDLVNEYLTSHLPSNGLSKDEVLDLIEQSVTNNHLPQLIGARDIEVALEPIKESVSELETYTRSQFAAVRDELKKAIDGYVATDAIANQTTVSQIFDEREEEPESTPTAQTPNSDYLHRLTELVGTGMTTNEIAQKLTDEGFTNREGGAISRKSIESKLKSNHELKEIYTNARTSGGSVE